MEQITFETLPKAVTNLTHSVTELRHLLIEKQERPQKAAEQLLTIKEVAKFLNITVPSVYSKVSKGELQVMKMEGSKRLYFSSVELMAYLQKGRKKSNAKTRGQAKNYLSKRLEKQYKLVYCLVGILFKKAIQVICDKIEIIDFTFLETPFHQIVLLFMNLFNFL